MRHLGQPPIDRQGLAERAEHDVLRLEIAVDHPSAVGVLHCLADLNQSPEQLA